MTKLLWIRRRARRIIVAYSATWGEHISNHIAVQAAAEDWFDLQGLPPQQP